MVIVLKKISNGFMVESTTYPKSKKMGLPQEKHHYCETLTGVHAYVGSLIPVFLEENIEDEDFDKMEKENSSSSITNSPGTG